MATRTSLPEDVQTAVYRILQEALANVGRHAGATAVAVEIEADDERLELRIRDDGAGFDPLAVAHGSNGGGPARASASAAWPSARGWPAASSTSAPRPAAARP